MPRISDISAREILDSRGNPTVEVTIDREKALRFELEPAFLADELRNRIQGTVATTYNEIEQRIDIAVRLPRDEQLLVDPLYAQAALELQELQSGLIAADRVTHRVRRGESLSVIARRYRVSVKDLQRWNNIGDPRRLRAGTTITVFHSPAAPQPAKSGSVKYVVQSGDSLWSIARKYKVRVNDLRSWNDLNGSMIRPGQSIRIEL